MNFGRFIHVFTFKLTVLEAVYNTPASFKTIYHCFSLNSDKSKKMFIQLLLLTSLLIVLFKFLTREHDYWHKRGVPYKVPYPFVGNLFRVIIKKETYQMALHRLYQESEGHRYCFCFVLCTFKILEKRFSTFFEHVIFYESGVYCLRFTIQTNTFLI